MRLIPILLLYFVLWGQAANAQRMALLVGNSDYPSGRLPGGGTVGRLEGPVNDVVAFERVLRQELGYQDAELQLHQNTTVQEFRQALATVASTAESFCNRGMPLQQFIFVFSGHGTQLADDNDDELDGQDEAFVLLPDDRTSAFDVADASLRDDEFYAFLRQMDQEYRVRDILIFVDACHSGGLAKDVPSWKVKRLLVNEVLTGKQSEAAKVKSDAEVESLPSELSKFDANIFFATACRPNETAKDGSPTSQFTNNLIYALQHPQDAAFEVDQSELTVSALAKALEVYLKGAQQRPVIGLKGDFEIEQLFVNEILKPGLSEQAKSISATRPFVFDLYMDRENGAPVHVPFDQSLNGGDSFRLRVRVGEDCYLYVIEASDSDNLFALFPAVGEPPVKCLNQFAISIPNRYQMPEFIGDPGDNQPPASFLVDPRSISDSKLRFLFSAEPIDQDQLLQVAENLVITASHRLEQGSAVFEKKTSGNTWCFELTIHTSKK